MRACHFSQGGRLRPRYQDQTGTQWVCQRFDCRLVLAALFLQPSQGAETGGIAFACLQKAAPGSRQLQQANGVAGGGGVKNDVIVIGSQRSICQQRGKFVKCGNFRGTGTGQLFFDALDDGVWQHTAHRADNPVAIGLCRSLWVDFKRIQSGHCGDRRNLVANADPEHLPDIGSRIGADQQYPLAGTGKLYGTGAADRGFADATFAGKKQKARCVVEK